MNVFRPLYFLVRPWRFWGSCTTQSVLWTFQCRFWHDRSHAYNVLKRREKKLGKSFRIQDVFVLHLVGGKPWEPGDPGAGEYPLSHGAWHAIRRECGLPDDGY